MESVLFDCMKVINDTRVILVDNIDLLSIETHPTCISALSKIIDYCSTIEDHRIQNSFDHHHLSTIITITDIVYQYMLTRRKKMIIIATCTSSSDIHDSLTQPYRLGLPMRLVEPSLIDKRDVLMSLLMHPTVRCMNDFTIDDIINPRHICDKYSYDAFVEVLANELVLYMQSFYIADIHRYINEQYQNEASLHNHNDLSCNDDSIDYDGRVRLLSSRELLKGVMNSNPTNSMSSTSSKIINRFMKQFDISSSEPLLIGMDRWKNHLLRLLSAAVPAINEDTYYRRWISCDDNVDNNNSNNDNGGNDDSSRRRWRKWTRIRRRCSGEWDG